MKQLLILVFCAIFLQAGLLDFVDASHAKNSYEKKDYKSAIKSYEKIQGKDGAAYDLANSYYKAKNYKKALSEYKKVNNPNLKFQKLHNMGNTYANLGKIDDAIKSYKEALKIKKDKDTKYNLDLLKKKKKKNQKKKKDKKKNKKSPKKKNKKDKKSGKNQKKDKNQKKSQNKQENKKGQKSQGEREKQKQNKDKQQNKQNKQQEQQKKGKGQKNKKASAQKNKKVQPISDMEERKYKKMLNQRGINTLMLPLSTKGEKRNEENPW